MTSRGRWCCAVVAAAALVAVSSPHAPGSEADGPFFSTPFPVVPDRVAVGADGTIYVAGFSGTSDLPASTPTPVQTHQWWGYFFVSAFAPDGHVLWTSYANGGNDRGVRALVVAPDGAVWIAGGGYLDAVNVPPELVGVGGDGFLAKFSPQGALLFAGNIGGEYSDWIAGLAIDAGGDAIVSGTTKSNDFPLAPVTPDDPLGWSDAFVARIRGDGSGIVWVRRNGTTGRDSGGGVALDAAGNVVVTATRGGGGESTFPPLTQLGPPGPIPGEPELGIVVLRYDRDGNLLGGANVAFLGMTTGDPNYPSMPVAIDAVGRVIVGGTDGVARLSPDLATLDATWREDHWSVASRLRLATDGRVVVVMGTYGEPYSAPVRTRVLGPDLVPRRDAEGLSGMPTDVLVDASGALLATGYGSGATFGAAGPVTELGAAFVARLPFDGVRPPSRVSAKAVGTDAALVSWLRDGDTPVRYEVESGVGTALPSVVGTADATASSLRVRGLPPGSVASLRVVSVFDSGVRTASAFENVTTWPVAPTNVVATERPDRSVQLSWASANGAATYYVAQRRIGSGPWRGWRADSYQWGRTPRHAYGWSSPLADRLPDVAAPVRYRVRARVPGGTSVWVESPAFVSGATLVVQPRAGRIARTSDGFVFDVSGTLARAGSWDPISFDPSTDELRLLYGDASSPSGFLVHANDPGWSTLEGSFVWRAADTLSAWSGDSEIVLDLANGTFRVHLVSSRATFIQKSHDVAFNLSLGALSGGDVRRWTGRSGRRPRLVLR